ncbi:MAG: tetraacyldisaccharide 4'-kinase [Phycisphaerae bacterium]|nr:tetraacyldisaccharide 4'-kinase [Phycisphaerae bacterium]
MNRIFWRKIVTCENPSFGYRLLRSILLIFSFFYRIAVALRNLLFDFSIFKRTKVDAAVVSIGNITTGGTGKTPLVAWLCNYFTAENITIAVLTRGYKGNSDFADEPAILAKACPKAQIIINPDRVEGAKKAITKYNAKFLIMDDGFQHRKLARDVDIVAIDATEPFGRGKLLPAGFLREPLSSLKRADAVVITRINQTQSAGGCLTAPEKIEEIKERVSRINPKIVFASAIHKPICARLIKDKQITLDELAGKRLYAFCGIGNPGAFFQTLSELALNIVGKRVYNDHHRYTESDIVEICQDCRYKQAEMIITTQKDWIKAALLCIEKFDIPIAYLAVELEFIDGQQDIVALVENAIKKYVSRTF